MRQSPSSSPTVPPFYQIIALLVNLPTIGSMSSPRSSVDDGIVTFGAAYQDDADNLPPGTELLQHQVAGHFFGIPGKPGLLRHTQSGDILKPLCDARARREHSFYHDVFENPQYKNDEAVVSLRPLVPRYNGTITGTLTHLSLPIRYEYIRLEDIAKQLTGNVSRLDMKIGQVTSDPEATPKKVAAEASKYKYTRELGFRILGSEVTSEWLRFGFILVYILILPPL